MLAYATPLLTRREVDVLKLGAQALGRARRHRCDLFLRGLDRVPVQRYLLIGADVEDCELAHPPLASRRVSSARTAGAISSRSSA